MFSRKRTIFQAIFWGGYIAVSLLIFAQFAGKSSGILLIMLLVGAGLYGASELLRTIMLKHGRLPTPGLPLLVCLLLLVPLAAAAVQCAIFVILKTALTFNWVSLPGGNADYRFGSVLGYIFNSAVMLWLWCGIWLCAYYVQRYQSAKIEAEIATWRAKAAQSKLELDVLKGQLNPHFTFNALNNLRAMINEDTDKARDMVTQLSNILRYTLHHNQHDRVALSDEIAVVRDYIALEQLHYEHGLNVRWKVETADNANATLPPMLLQLLVENAVKHGIAKRVGGGTINISIASENKLLKISVNNPGDWAQGDDAARNTGIGWNNLRERLKLVGGDGAACEIQAANNTVTISVTVPQNTNQAAI